MARSWPVSGYDLWKLWLESSSVIALRSWKLAAGGSAAQAEAVKMFSEKFESGVALQLMALSGKLGATPASAANKSAAHYLRKVRNNRRRLSKAKK